MGHDALVRAIFSHQKDRYFLELMDLKLFLLIFFLSNMGKQKVNDTWLENSIFSFCFKPWKIIKLNPLMQKHKQKTLQKFYLVKLSEILHFSCHCRHETGPKLLC